MDQKNYSIIKERKGKFYLNQPEDYNLGDSLSESSEDCSEVREQVVRIYICVCVYIYIYVQKEKSRGCNSWIASLTQRT